jgi:uncharacterized protein YbjT (DUF2867 family)
LDQKVTLITGATGYIGGRLLTALEQRGYRVRSLVRDPKRLKNPLNQRTEIVQGNVFDPKSLDIALKNVSVAYYLIHSMGSSGDYEKQDRIAARNFSNAARTAGLERIIYVGGLGNSKEKLSTHLSSRQEVGSILRDSGLNVVEFRASIVIGAGSLSFEMIRALVDRLPVMITPKWVSMKAQPIAIDDLISYLIEALHIPAGQHGVYEIGGRDQVTYAEIMRTYARMRGKFLYMIPVPVLTPYLSSLWLGLVTPLYAHVGRKLIESIMFSTVVNNNRALKVFNTQPMGIKEAICKALKES